MALGRARRITGHVRPELQPIVDQANRAIRELDRRKPATEPSYFADTASRPAAEKFPGRVIYVGGSVNQLQYSNGSDWVALTTGSGGAPTAAQYIVAAAHASLSAERVTTDTATVAWDHGTPAQAKANVPDNAITYAKMQNVTNTSRFIGRITGGSGDPEELTGTQATTLLDAFTDSLKGVAPASGGGTTNFLRADGSWAAPPGSGTGAFTKSITIESPTDAENISIWQAEAAITINEVRSVLRGSASPSVDWQVKHGTDRSAAGTNLFSSTQTTTSTTTGDTDNSGFNDQTVAAGEWVWLITSAKAGTVNEFHMTLECTYD